MTGVSNMADQGRIILQLYSVCNLSIGSSMVKGSLCMQIFLSWKTTFL